MNYSSASIVEEEDYEEEILDETLMWGVIIIEFIIIMSLSVTLLFSMGMLLLVY